MAFKPSHSDKFWCPIFSIRLKDLSILRDINIQEIILNVYQNNYDNENFQRLALSENIIATLDCSAA